MSKHKKEKDPENPPVEEILEYEYFLIKITADEPTAIHRAAHVLRPLMQSSNYHQQVTFYNDESGTKRGLIVKTAKISEIERNLSNIDIGKFHKFDFSIDKISTDPEDYLRLQEELKARQEQISSLEERVQELESRPSKGLDQKTRDLELTNDRSRLTIDMTQVDPAVRKTLESWSPEDLTGLLEVSEAKTLAEQLYSDATKKIGEYETRIKELTEIMQQGSEELVKTREELSQTREEQQRVSDEHSASIERHKDALEKARLETVNAMLEISRLKAEAKDYANKALQKIHIYANDPDQMQEAVDLMSSIQMNAAQYLIDAGVPEETADAIRSLYVSNLENEKRGRKREQEKAKAYRKERDDLQKKLEELILDHGKAIKALEEKYARTNSDYQELLEKSTQKEVNFTVTLDSLTLKKLELETEKQEYFKAALIIWQSLVQIKADYQSEMEEHLKKINDLENKLAIYAADNLEILKQIERDIPESVERALAIFARASEMVADYVISLGDPNNIASIFKDNLKNEGLCREKAEQRAAEYRTQKESAEAKLGELQGQYDAAIKNLETLTQKVEAGGIASDYSTEKLFALAFRKNEKSLFEQVNETFSQIPKEKLADSKILAETEIGHVIRLIKENVEIKKLSEIIECSISEITNVETLLAALKMKTLEFEDTQYFSDNNAAYLTAKVVIQAFSEKKSKKSNLDDPSEDSEKILSQKKDLVEIAKKTKKDFEEEKKRMNENKDLAKNIISQIEKLQTEYKKVNEKSGDFFTTLEKIFSSSVQCIAYSYAEKDKYRVSYLLLPEFNYLTSPLGLEITTNFRDILKHYGRSGDPITIKNSENALRIDVNYSSKETIGETGIAELSKILQSSFEKTLLGYMGIKIKVINIGEVRDNGAE